MATTLEDIQTIDITDIYAPPLAWTELEQVHHSLREIEQIADGELRRLGLHKLADEIVAHTKVQRRWVAAHT